MGERSSQHRHNIAAPGRAPSSSNRTGGRAWRASYPIGEGKPAKWASARSPNSLARLFAPTAIRRPAARTVPTTGRAAPAARTTPANGRRANRKCQSRAAPPLSWCVFPVRASCVRCFRQATAYSVYFLTYGVWNPKTMSFWEIPAFCNSRAIPYSVSSR